jgi:CRISPR type IV-associated protein Csf1
LFAGILSPSGSQKCFYCGGACDETHHVKNYVKKTFTNRDIVLKPSSSYVCSGCVCSLNERADIKLIDGEVRVCQKTRLYSWLFDSEGRTAFTKAHTSIIKNVVLNPPDPPFGIVFATSGQKQLLFRSVVSWSKDNYPVKLEEETIIVNISDLKKLLSIAERVIAAIGKPALQKMELNHAIKFFEYYDNLDMFNIWKLNMLRPISRLAAYLSPNQKECQIVHQKCDRNVNTRPVSA